jgi:hypothetical protein
MRNRAICWPSAEDAGAATSTPSSIPTEARYAANAFDKELARQQGARKP